MNFGSFTREPLKIHNISNHPHKPHKLIYVVYVGKLYIGENIMTTQKQLLANQQNALKSTGPVTVEGKLCSSKNAMTHGLLSKDLVVHGESTSEYEIFRQDLIDFFLPGNPIEMLLVEKIASTAWRLRRAVQAESLFFHKGLSSEYNRKYLESFFQGRDGQSLQHLTRYEAALEKKFYRALQELKECQKIKETTSGDLSLNGFV